jgi:predicted amidohydrolase YtcJ
MGLTGLHDFDRRDSFMALQKLHAQKKLKLRVLKNIPVELLDQAHELGLRGGFGDNTLRIGNVKVFMDGALGPHTAAMFQPYPARKTTAASSTWTARNSSNTGAKPPASVWA